MRFILILVTIFLLLSGCSLGGQRTIEYHFISMDEIIHDEHVKYENGTLLIDNQQIELPPGDTLRVSYRKNRQVTRYTVKVDGEVVEEAEIAAET